jgi:hypothetical protein
MSVVWKYDLDPLFLFTKLHMPVGAKVLTVGAQNGELRLWAEVDPLRRPEPRQFMAVPTGVEVDLHGTTYVGTVQLSDPDLVVFHVYAVKT